MIKQLDRPELASRFATLPRSCPSIVTRLDAGEVTPERFAGTLAAWMVMQSRSPNAKAMRGLEPVGFKPEWYQAINPGPNCHAKGFDNPRWTLAASIHSTPTPAIVSRLDAAQVVPDVLARWLFLQARNVMLKPVTESDGCWSNLSFYEESVTTSPSGFRKVPLTRHELASRVSSLPPGSLLALDAPDSDLPLPATLPWTGKPYRVVLFVDPPYLGADGDGGKTATTGYGSTCTRASVVALALRWLEAGKRDGIPVTVAISEACDLSAELAEATGQRWYGYDVGSMVKRGSNFWAEDEQGEKKAREWVTCSEPAHRLPARQGDLFAALSA